jgi:hypothetical protein
MKIEAANLSETSVYVDKTTTRMLEAFFGSELEYSSEFHGACIHFLAYFSYLAKNYSGL